MAGTNCEDCAAIKQLRLEIQLQLGRTIKKEFQPVLAELKKVSEAMIQHTEQLRAGNERFKANEAHQKDLDDRLDAVEQWQAGHDGAKREAVNAGRRAGLIWGASLAGLNLALQLIMWVAR
jgi:hypothetical protein